MASEAGRFERGGRCFEAVGRGPVEVPDTLPAEWGVPGVDRVTDPEQPAA